MIYVFWSAQGPKEAKRIIHSLLEKRLIACASIVPEVESVYRWKGRIEESQESKVILKTQAKHFESILSFIKKEGSYDVPEVSSLKIEKGNSQYLEWLEGEVD
jgi:periplasmic divalent cation tolerance protein